MKKIGKIVLWVFVSLIVVIDVLLTVYLLHYNQFNVPVFGNKTVLIMDRDFEGYKKGDLLLVSKTKDKDIRTGDYIFFYDTANLENVVNYGRVNMVHVNEKEELKNTYMMSNDYILGYESVIGSSKDVKVYAVWGTIIGTLASKWVFLFVVIMPLLIVFLYQLYLLIQDLKKAKK